MEVSHYLITGGSGFLGINLIRFLLARGLTVRSLDKAPFDYPEKDRIEVVAGDIRDPLVVDRAMVGITQVVHTAAALPLYLKEEIFSTEIEGTRLLLEAALRHRVDRFIHISSTAVYGIIHKNPIEEDDSLQGVGPYGEAKIQAEALCATYREKGLCIPILRPKSFIGPERLGVFAMLYEWAKDGKHFPMLGQGRNRYQFLDVDDLCEAIWLCSTLDRDGVNDVFNIGAETFRALREDLQAVLDHAGHSKRLIPLPAGPIIFLLRVLECFKLSPLYEWIYKTVGTDSFVSTEKARRVLGFSPKYSNQQALIRNYEWYLAHFDSFRTHQGITHRQPWKQGALKLAKLFF